jgi:hypothetical protein
LVGDAHAIDVADGLHVEPHNDLDAVAKTSRTDWSENLKTPVFINTAMAATARTVPVCRKPQHPLAPRLLNDDQVAISGNA